jgi:hypothetical protein
VPDELLRTIRGYQDSRVLLTALELDVFTAVAPGATAQKVASARRLDARGTLLLLNALVALGVLAKKADVFSNTPLAARYLAAGAADDARDALRHNLSLWARWSTLTDAVRTGHAVASGPTAARGEHWTIPFIAAMHKNAVLRAPLVVQTVGGARRLLDVGGGSGAYAIAFAQANPDLHAQVFDLPGVLPIAQQHITAAGLEDRIRTRAGRLRLGPRSRAALGDLPHAQPWGEPGPATPGSGRARSRRPRRDSGLRRRRGRHGSGARGPLRSQHARRDRRRTNVLGVRVHCMAARGRILGAAALEAARAHRSRRRDPARVT